MLKINYDETIEICQGDRGFFSITFKDYEITNSDLISFIIKNDDLTILKKKPFKIDSGIAFFELKTEDTINLNEGIYTYFVVVKLNEDICMNIVTEKEFKIKRGVIYEL